jgi:hypothetical protein
METIRHFLSAENLRHCVAVVLGAALLSAGGLQGQQRSATLINVQPGEAVAVADALKAIGLEARTQDATSTSFTGEVVVLEARGELSAQTLLSLKNYVQRGGSLLIGLDKRPGIAPAQLAFLSPTTAWITQAESGSRPLVFSEIESGVADPEMFGTARQQSFTVPYFFPIRPVSAVERGTSRYDRYEQRTANYLFDHEAGKFYWTRPLLDRDWKVRLEGNDRASSPLLLTGRYGAGRVAVFASSLAGKGAALESFWKPVMAWLTTPASVVDKEPSPASVEISAKAAATADGADSLRISLKNRTSQPLSLQVIDRILTWEEAWVGDSIAPIELPANGAVSIDVPMPKPGPLEYQALQWRRAFVVRAGVLSKSGATLLAETIAPVELTPSPKIELSTDNLYRVTYPYPTAPGIDAFPAIQNRMGMPIGQYAYPPSSTVHATAVFSNGVHNIAALATVSDETTPNNPSIVAINDGGARANKGPHGGMEGYGAWNGRARSENVLRFHFPSPVTITGVTLLGAATDKHSELAHNPGAVSIECDGRSVLKKNDLDSSFVSEAGLVHLSFGPVQATELVVRLPWVEAVSSKERRTAPSLGEVEIEGTQGALSSEVHGEATLVLRNAMTAVETVVGAKSISIPPGGRVVWPQSFKLPQTDTAFYQLLVRFAGETRSVPILVIQPARTLGSVERDRPSGAPVENFVTTKGFRNAFPLGTGTRDAASSWETPDDLVWAYSHQVKQIDAVRRSWANWLYLTDSDMRHYSTPWTLFNDGESVFKLAAPNLVEQMKRQRSWATSKKVFLGFGDRWDAGPSLPSLYGWQELVAFDEYLRSVGKRGLSGATHDELNRDVNQNHAAEWALWHERRYVETVELLRNTFASAGKELVMSGQGIPMTSNADAAILSRTVKGMSSDNTWGMEGESVPFTTGRQLADQAFNPEWKLGFNMVWGYDSSTLNNSFWYSPVGTTEASRRHWYDSAWRGIVNERGEYVSSFDSGYGNNGGEAWTMALNDYQQAWDATERFSLFYPDAPLGAGLIVSSSPVDSPASTLFNGGGMGPVSTSEALVGRVATTFERLHDAGLSIPFTGNILGMRQRTQANPLIVYDASTVSAEELDSLRFLANHGTRIAVFAGEAPLSPPAAELFGIAPDGATAHAVTAGLVGGQTLLSHGNFLYIPFPANSLTPQMSLQLAPILQKWLHQPIVFPTGTMGYGFVSGGRTMVVLEDWQEKAREVSVRIHATGVSARAISLNDHASLPIRRDGVDWVVTLPLRAGDGDVVVLEERDLQGILTGGVQ